MPASRFLKLFIVLVASIVTGCTVVDRVKSDFSLIDAHKAYHAEDYTTASNHLLKGAELGSGEAAYLLSDLYLTGKGVKKDVPTGVKWMREASERNYLPADVSIGLWTIGGLKGIKKNPVEGAERILKAAQAGESEAMMTMGSLYMKGAGVTRSAEQALHWFQKAEKAGVAVDPGLLTIQGIEKNMRIRR